MAGTGIVGGFAWLALKVELQHVAPWPVLQIFIAARVFFFFFLRHVRVNNYSNLLYLYTTLT